MIVALTDRLLRAAFAQGADFFVVSGYQRDRYKAGWVSAVGAGVVAVLVLGWVDALIVAAAGDVATHPLASARAWLSVPIVVLTARAVWLGTTWRRARADDPPAPTLVARLAAHALLVAVLSSPVAVRPALRSGAGAGRSLHAPASQGRSPRVVPDLRHSVDHAGPTAAGRPEEEAVMVAEIFGMDGVIVLVVGIVPLAVVIWGVVDAARRPEEVWQRALQNKALWITLQAVGLLFCWIGFILSIVYLAAIRPKLAAVEANGGSGYGTLDYGAGGGQSAPGWYPDPQVPSQLRYWDGQAWTAQSAPQ